MGRALGRNYTDAEKTTALIAYDICHNDATAAARFCREHNKLPVSADQISRWANGNFIAPEVRKNAEVVKGELSDKFLGIAHRCVDLAKEKLDDPECDVPLEKLMTSAAIATDKYRLLTEQSTVNVSQTLTPEDRLHALEQLRQSVEERLRLQAQEGQVIEAEFEDTNG